MKNKKLLYIIGGIVIVLLIAVIISNLTSRVKMNPAGTVGNTAGNLNNDGLFCEYDGTVYFANPADNGALYSMSPNETEIKKLNNLQVRNILAGGDYLYYFQYGSSENAEFDSGISSKSFNRSNLKGKNVQGISRDVVVSAQLVDNYLYMLIASDGGPVFSKLKIDKSDSAILANYEINPACAENGIIYFNDTRETHYLQGWDTSSDTKFDVWDGNIWYPVMQGDYVYYLDVAENYRLCRYSLSQNLVEVLTNDRVDCYNIRNGYIYYQKNGDQPQLKCMLADGSNAMVVADGNYTDINTTSAYVYFRDFANENVWYHCYLGTTDYSTFNPSGE